MHADAGFAMMRVHTEGTGRERDSAMGGLTPLALAVGLFAATHLVPTAPAIRTPIVHRVGETTYRIVYSVIAAILVVWAARAYGGAPVVDIWSPPVALRHLSLSLMPLACILLVAGITTPNPSAIGSDTPQVAQRGPNGIVKVTRHPVMWAIGLWGLLHLLANGDAAAMILFGGMTAVALGGAAAQDRKKRRLLGAAWEAFARQTSFVPFLAIRRKQTKVTLREVGYGRIAGGIVLYLLMLALHRWLFGVNPLAAG
jgi:Predicted membrane protein